MLSLYEILKASKTGIAPDMWTALAGKNWGGIDSGHEIKELTGIPPLSFTADGSPLIDYLISGNMSQTGTPTPTTPIQPSECGNLVNSQWTLPIFSAGQTNNIYLGEVQTTRRIRKLVLTGDEYWTITSGKFYYTTLPSYPINWLATITSHFEVKEDISTTGCARFGGTATIPQNTFIFNYDNGVGGIASWKSYLAQQYANGTPVCVWYVLANETTGIVNEPIRKIGDYADTVSMEQAGVQIPTLHGNTVIDVETTLKPSEMYIKYQE